MAVSCVHITIPVKLLFESSFLNSESNSFQEDLSRLGEIENSLVVFFMATYGEGDPTDNAQEFYEWLQNGDVDLSGIKFAVGIFFYSICRLYIHSFNITDELFCTSHCVIEIVSNVQNLLNEV